MALWVKPTMGIDMKLEGVMRPIHETEVTHV